MFGSFLGIFYAYFKFILQNRVLWKIGKKVLENRFEINKGDERTDKF